MPSIDQLATRPETAVVNTDTSATTIVAMKAFENGFDDCFNERVLPLAAIARDLSTPLVNLVYWMEHSGSWQWAPSGLLDQAKAAIANATEVTP